MIKSWKTKNLKLKKIEAEKTECYRHRTLTETNETDQEYASRVDLIPL